MSESVSAKPYQVLARKYRPATFEDMIGQEAMVTTLTNAFKAGRIAHAFMLTGVRGIGKTTTARLLARALNYQSEKIDTPSTELAKPGVHCEAIMTSSHMDVLEMDAASRTGVENMRELLDGVRYAPVSARYKVYIIDEVHMLSTGAFNALLKTLEEPPDHAKFIFATTEIRKVPVTVLSRCQRFDLRRVEASVLKDHLDGICEKEKVKIDPAGQALIARAAEGSVRDALSLLDQAIVQGGTEGTAVSLEEVQSMLGLADRGRVVDLFISTAMSDAAAALTEMRAQYDDGADPVVVMRDLLDICHDVSRAKTLGDAAEFDSSPDQAKRLKSLADDLTSGQLSRIWQMLLKSYGEVRTAPVPLAAAEMALLKIATAEILKELKSGNFSAPVVSSQNERGGGAAKARSSHMRGQKESFEAGPSGGAAALSVPKPASVAEPALQLQSLTEFTENLSDSQIQLKYDVEKYVQVIRFKTGAITIAKMEKAPVTLIGRMVEALRDMTGELWLIEQDDGKGAPSISEARKLAIAERDARDRSHPAFSHSLLKKAKLIEIRDVIPKSGTNIIAADFSAPREQDET